MNERFVKHGTFVVERIYAAPPERVYQAWADPIAKAKWFSKPEIFEFQVGDGSTAAAGRRKGRSLPSMPATRSLFQSSVLSIRTHWIQGCTHLRFHHNGRAYQGGGRYEVDIYRARCIL